MADVGERALVIVFRFLLIATSVLDIEKEPLVLEAAANEVFQGLRGCKACFLSLRNLLGERSVENARGFSPGFLRISWNMGLFKGLSFKRDL
jgi:hypothetical protein